MKNRHLLGCLTFIKKIVEFRKSNVCNDKTTVVIVVSSVIVITRNCRKEYLHIFTHIHKSFPGFPQGTSLLFGT